MACKVCAFWKPHVSRTDPEKKRDHYGPCALSENYNSDGYWKEIKDEPGSERCLILGHGTLITGENYSCPRCKEKQVGDTEGESTGEPATDGIGVVGDGSEPENIEKEPGTSESEN